MSEIRKITTIKLEKETKARLDKLKEHEKESYNQVIKKILYILNLIRRDPLLGNKLLDNIDKTVKRKQTYNKQINKPSQTSEF
jgi:hypothetical protein